MVGERVTYDYVGVMLFEQSLALIGICHELVSTGFLMCNRDALTFCIPCVNNRVLVLHVRDHTADKTLRPFRGIVDGAQLKWPQRCHGDADCR
jgi:hypothetical protein